MNKKKVRHILMMSCQLLTSRLTSNERCSLCRHGFTALCKGLHQTRSTEGVRKGGKEGKECTGVRKNWNQNRAVIITKSSIKNSNMKGYFRKIELSKFCSHPVLVNQLLSTFSSLLKNWFPAKLVSPFECVSFSSRISVSCFCFILVFSCRCLCVAECRRGD